MDKTAVIVLHYQNNEDTYACLNSFLLEHKKAKDFQTIVINNSVSENFSVLLQKKYPQIQLVENKENLGYAAGVNIGIKRALSENYRFIIILNNDTLLTKDTIIKLVKLAESDSSIGLISPKIYFTRGFEYHRNLYQENEKGTILWYAGGILDWANIYASHQGVDQVDKGQFDKIVETDFATGCCMLVTKEVIQKIGLFDEKYFLYFEDIDLSVRAKRAGFRVIYQPKACLSHKNASTSGKPGSLLHLYYQTRNRLYFGYKYASFRTKKALFFDSLRLLCTGGMCTKAVFDYYLGKMGKGSI